MEYGLIGEKLGHSYSKTIHEQLGSYDYTLCPLSREEFPAFMKARDFRAINVTIPYKKAVLPYLDELDERAAAIGAVNTIVNKNGRLIGHNTDFGGFLYMIESAGIAIAGKKVLVLGTGGASLAVLAVLRHLAAGQILSVSQTAGKDCITYEQCYESHTDAQVIVNTTPVGMYPKIDASPLDLSRFPACEVVLDIVYNPGETLLTAQARVLGRKAVTGLSMLVAQAKYAYEYFMDTEASEELIPQVCRKLEKSLSPVPGPVTVKGLTLGEGMPKICIPLTGSTKEILTEQARALEAVPCDLAEWRVDYFEQADSPEAVLDMLKILKAELKEFPWIFTFRTQAEGGQRPFTAKQYETLLAAVLSLGRPDFLDMEYHTGVHKALLPLAAQTGVRTILSCHNFSHTPSREAMLALLQDMDAAGGDILKLAVMPQTEEDVTALLETTVKMNALTDRPLITMSMGALGQVSRYTGTHFGSCLTFGTAGAASAPGQLDAKALKELLLQEEAKK